MSVTTKTLQIRNLFSVIKFKTDANLLNTLNANKVSISQSCDGNGTCTSCRVFILKGVDSCSPRTEVELERATERNFLINERLACQTTIGGDLEIEILNPEPIDV